MFKLKITLFRHNAGLKLNYWLLSEPSHFSLLSTFNKMPPFLHFSIAKGGKKTIAHLSIAEGMSFRRLDRCIYNCKLRNEKKINPSAQ
jgi:hypothetical protein